MSSKEDFLKKLQENQNNQQNRLSQVKADIAFFCSAMFDLTKQIEIWLDGSGLQVVTKEHQFKDESISFIDGCEALSTYQIAICTMQNGAKSAVVKSESVYGDTASKGWASLIIDTPNRAPRIQRFLLRLCEDRTWTIRNDDMPTSMHDPLIKPEYELTEENFFQAIQSLA